MPILRIFLNVTWLTSMDSSLTVIWQTGMLLLLLQEAEAVLSLFHIEFAISWGLTVSGISAAVIIKIYGCITSLVDVI